MRDPHNVFHLAIPCSNLEETREFYVRLGCRLARSYSDRITLDFFGDQVVCHLYPEGVDVEPHMFPRHFGTTFSRLEDYEALLAHCREEQLRFFADPFVRFEGLAEEHRTFFLVDPSNNVLEFKHYNRSDMMY